MNRHPTHLRLAVADTVLDIAKYNLLHFAWVEWSDAWDGKSVPKNGWINSALLYQGKIKFGESVYWREGKPDLSQTKEWGDPRFVPLYHVSRAFFDVLTIVHHWNGDSKKQPQLVLLDQSTYVKLLGHPQFETFMEEMCRCGNLVLLNKVNYDTYQVVVQKRTRH